jgi:hypothetical protein
LLADGRIRSRTNNYGPEGTKNYGSEKLDFFKMVGSGCGKMMRIPPDPDQQHRKIIKLSFIKRSNADEE